MKAETIHEFALRALVAAGHISQAKVDQALEIAQGFQAHTTQPPAGGAVEKLPDKWRSHGCAVLRCTAEELEAALAQDRASFTRTLTAEIDELLQ